MFTIPQSIRGEKPLYLLFDQNTKQFIKQIAKMQIHNCFYIDTRNITLN